MCCGASARIVRRPPGSSEVSGGLFFNRSHRDFGSPPRQDLCHTSVTHDDSCYPQSQFIMILQIYE